MFSRACCSNGASESPATFSILISWPIRFTSSFKATSSTRCDSGLAVRLAINLKWSAWSATVAADTWTCFRVVLASVSLANSATVMLLGRTTLAGAAGIDPVISIVAVIIMFFVVMAIGFLYHDKWLARRDQNLQRRHEIPLSPAPEMPLCALLR